MPLLPGLDGAEATVGPSLTDLLDTITEEQAAELVTQAQAWKTGEGGQTSAELDADSDEEPATMDEADEMGEGEEVAEGEEVEEGDAEAEAKADELEAAGDYDGMLSWAETTTEELNTLSEDLSALLDTAEENEESGADPDGVQEAIDALEPLVEQAQEHSDAAAAAAKAEDPKACGEACLRLERVLRRARALLVQAQACADSTSVGGTTVEDEPAVKLWADRSRPKVDF